MASSQHGFAPPPPHASASVYPQSPVPASPSRGPGIVPRRRVGPIHPRQALPTITTTLSPTPGSALLSVHTAHTPTSAVSAPNLSIPPFSPYASAATPVTATATRAPQSPMALRSAAAIVAPYNPSEWHRSGPVTGAYVPYASPPPPAPVRTTEITGMESANMPSPPPPYSPSVERAPAQAHNLTSPVMSNAGFTPIQPHSQNSFREASSHNLTSPVMSNAGFTPIQPHSQNSFRDVASPINPSNVASPIGGISPFDQNRISTVSQDSPRGNTPPAFPPPPGRSGRDRSVSRHRPDGRSILSGLSALTSRNRTTEQAPAPNAIDSLRYYTSEVLSRHNPPQINAVTSPSNYGSPPEADFNAQPPAARRCASTGGIGIMGAGRGRGTPEQSESPGPQQYLQAGMPLPGPPLPGPPPGPPPPNSIRSQSMSRTSDRSYPSSRGSTPLNQPAPATRRPPQTGTQLGPVPPTPADWVETPGPHHVSHNRSSSGRLFVDTNVGNNSRPVENFVEETASTHSNVTHESQSAQVSTASATSSTSLSRQHAKRDPSARGIRERRSESRAARERAQEVLSASEVNNNPWAHELEAAGPSKPANLELASPMTRRRKVSVATIANDDHERGSPSTKHQGESKAPSASSHKHDGSRSLAPPGHHPTDTPPFSPVDGGSRARGKSPAIPPVALPTPPQRNSGEYFRPSSKSSSSERPISHLFHSPNDEHNVMAAPLVPSGSAKSSSTPRPSEQELFVQASVERHRAFVEKESTAKDDQERLEIFAEFIVAESRLRRDRYSAAFDGMAGEIMDLTRDLFRSYGSGRRSTTPVTTPAAASDGTRLSRATTASSVDSQNIPSSPSSANYTPRTDLESPMSTTSQGRSRGEDPPIRAGAYKPCLSPIPSMAMSTVPDDEEDSRGRSQSRWWEQSADGGSSGRGGRKLERSKRESKYMGLPVEHLIQLENEVPSPGAGGTPKHGPSQQTPPAYYGANEYPPEKTGLHDVEQQLTPKYPYWNHSAPTTPDPYKMDISRLITLPPPYPRHHPAVNNSHPDLAPVRNTHRTCADLTDVEEVKSAFAAKLDQLREKHQKDAKSRRERIRANIQSQVQSGGMSYAAAAQAESSFEADEPKRIRDALKVEYEAYCAEVMTPLHGLLSERVTKSNAAIEHLRNALNAARDSRHSNTQEEGDERPELLEKLTLLKWLHEARETAHRELFSLESERNEMYKALVVLPYRAAGQEDKAVDAEQFFEHDEKERRGTLEKESSKRVELLMDVVEENVTRGVEDLLGAFWDIAPGLHGVVQKIPQDLRRERPDLLIPPDEFDENPSYIDHPLQYLYTLLMHAEKSAYQFIESQTNLLCLLHEVKTSVMVAGSKVMESERVAAGEGEASVCEEMEEVRRMEEERLTADLKDKVRIVEGQWREGLGDALGRCRKRVEMYLEQTGGWDENLQE